MYSAYSIIPFYLLIVGVSVIVLRSTTTELGGNEAYEYVGAMERVITLNYYSSTTRHHVCSQQTHKLITMYSH